MTTDNDKPVPRWVGPTLYLAVGAAFGWVAYWYFAEYDGEKKSTFLSIGIFGIAAAGANYLYLGCKEILTGKIQKESFFVFWLIFLGTPGVFFLVQFIIDLNERASSIPSWAAAIIFLLVVLIFKR